ncbi:MAG: rod-binding protein [Rhodobacteraceae bacterium]|jgi:Rod binding domain-containing protein|nr:rod-binding protein [Paracoccaceae bacterium]
MTEIPPSLPPSASPATAIRRSAEALETAFLSEMLKSAGVFKPSESFGGGEGEEQFTSFFADAQARAMVARGGLGLADHIERSLLARQHGAQP